MSASIKCPNCQKMTAAGQGVCEHCGSPLPAGAGRKPVLLKKQGVDVENGAAALRMARAREMFFGAMKKSGGAFRKNAMLIVLVAVYVFFLIVTQGSIFNPTHMNLIIKENAYVYILGCGMLMCMLTGGNIDLSCGAFVCLLGSIGGYFLVNMNIPSGYAILLMLGIAIADGCLLGFLIAYVRIPPWIVTLAGYLSFRGLGTELLAFANPKTNSIKIPKTNDFVSIFNGTLFQTPRNELNRVCLIAGVVMGFIVVLSLFIKRDLRIKKQLSVDSLPTTVIKAVVGAGAIMVVMWQLALNGGIPTVLLWVVGIVLVYGFITGRTTVGRRFYVVGGNQEAARMSGVNTKRIMFTAYLNMAFLTALATMTVMSRLQAANAQMGTNFEMDAIAACVVGGVSASGGAGTIFGMVIGATLIGVINHGMPMIGVNIDMQKVVKGLVLLGAVVFDILSKKRSK